MTTLRLRGSFSLRTMLIVAPVAGALLAWIASVSMHRGDDYDPPDSVVGPALWTPVDQDHR